MDDAIFDCIPVVKFNNESKNNRKTSLNSKVASSLALRVSWLKFEPRSRISPCKISHFGLFYYCYSKKFFFLFLLDKKRFFKFCEVIILQLVQATNENEETMEEVVTRNKWRKITSLMVTN